jgi:hypothetical protein
MVCKMPTTEMSMNFNERRQILLGLTASLPAVWIKPSIEAMILPAHAQTSPVDESVSPDPDQTCISKSCSNGVIIEASVTSGDVAGGWFMGIFDASLQITSETDPIGLASRTDSAGNLVICLNNLADGDYLINMSTNGTGVEVRVDVTFCTGTDSAPGNEPISGGPPNGSGKAVAGISFPDGTLQQ